MPVPFQDDSLDGFDSGDDAYPAAATQREVTADGMDLEVDESAAKNDQGDPDSARIERIERALSDLTADAFRTGRNPTAAEIDKAVFRHKLDAVEAALLELQAREERLVAKPVQASKPSDDETSDALAELAPLFADARRFALLSASDEAELARAIESGRQAEARLASAEPTTDAVGRQLRETVARGRAANDRFVNSNVRLVVSIAKRFQGHGLEMGDLVQEGLVGLMSAVRKFDWRLGYKFSTYATWWVRQAIERALADKGRVIRLPVHVSEQVWRVKRASRLLEATTGRQPTLAEVAEAVNEDVATVAFLRDVDREVASLDQPMPHDPDGRALGEVLRLQAQSVESEVQQHLLALEVGEVLALLTPRQRTVIERRYGIGGCRPETLESVGESMGVTRERIRQIQAKAETRLKQLLEKRHIGVMGE